MAGHSQFKNIMHRKGRQDAMRSKIFSKIAREITVATKLGSPEPSENSRLRLAIQNAKVHSMPKDNIERAIKKALGNNTENYINVRYEGYGPGGIAIIVEALTDNRNRTASNVRSIFTKSGGSLGETGSVSFCFEQLGEIIYKSAIADPDIIMEAAIEAGAHNFFLEDEEYIIHSPFEIISDVSKKLEELFNEANSVKIIWKPKNPITILEEEKIKSLLKMMDLLEEDEDIQNVYSNLEVPNEMIEKALIIS
ncbi:hypothetical protein B488_12240 [Liberibacter crescens BT-1]|uniref:Probable transcriptional regulatory protein B488_12240 n=1 Tax=Liberibacter crescens (strain BT-1) TaxID=1215343 RepID=L0EXW3_LIBCB|nr:YebC/PmpR family DNA-binding transcriptional regulator [Liberibacter crescens]AGA65216.1 hypothetical protein B488_12240 [Liberibacter crescens BT-1]AMC13166.1 transcriptional regulator [Liberibacter crescens]